MTRHNTTLRHRGFSLVELMVALLLGAVITLGITQMFTGNKETYEVLQGQSRMQENARFALDFISRPLRMSGFSGCISSEVEVQNRLNVADDEVPFMHRLGVGVEGFEGTGAGTWAPALTALPADIQQFDTDDRLAGLTDLLVVRTVDNTALELNATMPTSSADIPLVTPADLTLFAAGDYALISDCDKVSLFRVTGVSTAGGYSLAHSTGSVGAPGSPRNASTSLTDDGTTYDPDAFVYKIRTGVFFIAERPDGAPNKTNNAGADVLSLWYKEGDGVPVELVEGVEDLQVLFGVDTDNDAVPNRYRTINNIPVDDWPNIRTARVSLTVNSVNRVTDATPNGLLTRTFSRTVALRNRLQPDIPDFSFNVPVP